MKNVIIIFISLFFFSCNNKTKEDSAYVVDGESEAICDSMITTILSYMPGFVPLDTAYYLTPDSVMADEDRDGRDMISKVVRTVRGKDTLYIEATSHKHNTISSSNNLRDIKDIRRHNLLMKEMFADNPRFKLILPIIGEKILFAEYILPEPKLEDYGLTEKDIQNRDSLMQLLFR